MDLVAALQSLSTPLAWLSVALFVAVAGLDATGRRELARRLAVAAWATFGTFWLSLAPHFIFGMRSAIEGLLSLVALPACLYVAYLLYGGRDSLFVLSRAVAFMGVIYLPFAAIVPVRGVLVEMVASQVHAVITALGYSPELLVGDPYGFESHLVFTTDGHEYRTFLVLACSGIGSISIFGGLVAAVKAPLRRKLLALGVVVPVIYALNIVRNVFIALAFGKQWLQVYATEIAGLVGYEDPGLVSFFLADRVLSQSASVVALVLLALFVARLLPELFVVVDDVLFVLTGREFELAERLGGGKGGGGGGGAGGAGGSGGQPAVTDGGQ